ncbi:MAG: macrolide ABC transporter ATP-binding protein [Chloroflexi bacterium]|nr:macrolide ABC transporter ATP-binding protein [Chloroflexota bacterium]|tara:strand:+ start:771 stop:1445 length:675 start_codon:yes stop_codon:yes gene_type:complete
MIELLNVSKTYQLSGIEVNAVKSVNLNINQGEFASIMGPSGSGKSTMMNILGCLDVPSSGEYLLDDIDVGKLSDNKLAEIRGEKVGFIFQTYNLLPRISAIENVMMGLSYISNKDIKNKAEIALEKVGLKDRMKHKPVEMSGGEQQRVSIARALVKNPRIVLADEPTGALDTKTGSEIMQILTSLNIESKITVLIVTHEPDIAKQTKRIISFRDGEIISDERNK